MKQTTLCYIEKDNKLLMLYRNKKENDENRGKWIGIGGKLEVGETPEECLLREVREETKLILKSYRLCGTIDFILDAWEDERTYLYMSDDFEGEVDFDCCEGELKWIPKEEILDINLWEGDRIFLQDMLDGKDVNLCLHYDKEDKLVQVIRM